MKRSLLLGFLLLLFSISPLLAAPTKAKERFLSHEREYLVEMYEAKGFYKCFFRFLFHYRRLKKRPSAIAKNIHKANSETGRDYADFTNSYSMWRAKKFQRKWRTTLARAAKKFDVEEEVIVSILLIETGLGSVMGKYPVIAVFSSIIVEHEQNKGIYAQLDQMDAKAAYPFKRLAKKAKWAEVELEALLVIADRFKQSPYRYKGSYAGAFGLPQFLPSSYLKWGFDADSNGTVNLFLEPDAIYSTAHYLKSHGWKRGIRRKSNQEVIYQYNHSRPYVKAILKVARMLEKKKPKA